MPYSLVQLETFARLAELESFTRTAESLHLTQPAVTQQVRALADAFATPLVEIVGRRIRLTDAGRRLAEHARAFERAAAELERDMADFADARVGRLALGATVTIGNYYLPASLGAFALERPGASVELTIANTASIVDAVRDGRLALGLVEGPVDDDALAVEAYGEDELVLVVPPVAHALSDRAAIDVEQLRGARFVVREAGSGTRAIADAILATAGVRAEIAYAFTSNEGVVRAVSAGLGVALVAAACVEQAVAAGSVRRVAIANATTRRPLSLVRDPARVEQPLAAAFAALVRRTTPR